MMKRDVVKKVFYSPYFLSFILTAVIILFLPPLFSKFKIVTVEKGKTNFPKEIIIYHDLDGDGNSEKIISYISSENRHAIQIYNPEGGIIDQWNLKGLIAGEGSRVGFGDFDHDGLKEVICFSATGDSIFLSVFEPVEKGDFLVKNRFITDIDPKVKKRDYQIGDIRCIDFKNVGVEKLVFSISSSTYSPKRCLYIYDPATDSLIHSPPGASNVYDLKFTDLNEDGILEIIGNTYACGNFPDATNMPFSDYSGWLMAFDERLNFLFDPIEFPGFHTRVMVQPCTRDGKNYILTSVNNTGAQKITPALYLYDHSGKVIKTREFTYAPKTDRYLYRKNTSPDKYLVFMTNGSVFGLDPELDIGKIADLNDEISERPVAVLDADGDGDMEYIFRLIKNGSLAVFRNDFSNPVIVPLTGKGELQNISLIKSSNNSKTPLLFVQKGENFYKYRYGFNRLYFFQYPLYFGIYLSVLLLILLIRKLQQLQMKEKLALQNSITELQLKTINSQLNPHFTFNAFNAIAALLKNEKGETAYAYFLKFSNLVRAGLLSADQISRTLEEELTTIRDYLDIQQLRFKHNFDYEIKVDETVDLSTRIPKMILQNYVENAVKHGLRHRDKGGLLTIEIRKENKIILFIVQDNGVGRVKAAELESESTGMGMQIMQQYFDLLNRFNAMKIKQTVVDLYDDSGKPAGTKVIIEIPEKINFNLYHGLR